MGRFLGLIAVLLAAGCSDCSGPFSSCCKMCNSGQACGDSCIAAGYSCTKPKGCACDAPLFDSGLGRDW